MENNYSISEKLKEFSKSFAKTCASNKEQYNDFEPSMAFAYAFGFHEAVCDFLRVIDSWREMTAEDAKDANVEDLKNSLLAMSDEMRILKEEFQGVWDMSIEDLRNVGR